VITKADGTEEPAPPILPSLNGDLAGDVPNVDASNGNGRDVVAPSEPRHGNAT
jgi:hypothetical protein